MATPGETTEEVVSLRKTPVMWGIPCDEVIYAKFFTLFQKHACVMPWDGFAISEGTYVPQARNIIHKAFLQDSKLPYLMMIDSDIVFPLHLVDRLLSHNLPIVGGWYKNKRDTHHPVVYDFVSEPANFRHRDGPGNGLERVDGMGAGCWLMSRQVAEALGEEPYNMEGGGEDMKLSRKLMELGIPLHVDWDIPLAHLGVMWV